MARTSKYQTAASDLAQPKWRAGLYIRLSREDGDKVESESVSSQKAILQKFVSENDDISVYDLYVDDGWSGTDFERPAFRRMFADVTTKKINCVIVKDLSRFGRNYVEAGKYLETVFPLFNVRFIAVNDMIDSSANPQSANNIIVPFKNIINDEYCRDISMKVRTALDIRRRQGKFIGSFAAYGYKKDENDHSKLVIDEEAAQTVKFIFNKFLSGYSIMGIARELNARGISNPSAYKAEKGLKTNRGGIYWVDSTVRRILTNELYIGNLVQKKNQKVSYKIHLNKKVESKNRITVKNTHEAIIAESDFEKVQSLLARDTRTSPKERQLSVLAGFIKCADCGRAMQKRTVKQPYRTYEYYCCPTYRKMHSKACTKHTVRADVIENALLTFLNKYIAFAVDFDRLAEKINRARGANAKPRRLAGELSVKRQELEKAQKLLLEIYPDFKSGIISRGQYFALKEKYENAALKARESIERLNEEISAYKKGVKENEFIAAFKKFKGLKELTREVVVELVDNIYVHEGGEIEIHFKFKDALLAAEEYVKGGKESSSSTGIA